MKKRSTAEVESLARRVAKPNPQDIDELYGLEPVYEPGKSAEASPLPEEFVAVQCPYCGERLETRVDVSGGELTYIEDCQVCCRPIEFSLEIADSGGLKAVRVQRLD